MITLVALCQTKFIDKAYLTLGGTLNLMVIGIEDGIFNLSSNTG